MILAPPPSLTISEWADAKRRLSSEASAEPGQWRTSRAAYQRGIMDAISDPAIETVVVMSSAQVGKALALDTPVPTPSGWKSMGELAIDDTVFDDQGRPCRVTFASPVMHGRPCFRVVFSDGGSIVADAEHLWQVHSDTLVPHVAEAASQSGPDDTDDRGNFQVRRKTIPQ